MNIFVAGLPPHACEFDLRAVLRQLPIEGFELHVSLTQGSFAFIQVLEDQVAVICEKFDGVKYQDRFLHVSKVRPHTRGCRRCFRLGHTQENCPVAPASKPEVPQSLVIQERVNVELEKSEQELEAVIEPGEPDEAEVIGATIQPEEVGQEDEAADEPANEAELEIEAVVEPAKPEEPKQTMEVDCSILFAKQWACEEDSDEWPTDKQALKVETHSEPLPSLPLKRKRSEEEEPLEEPQRTPAKFLSGVKISKTEQDKEMLKALRETGSTSCGDARFELLKQTGAVNVSSKVTCDKCQTIIMVKSVAAHVLSKSHQRAASNL